MLKMDKISETFVTIDNFDITKLSQDKESKIYYYKYNNDEIEETTSSKDDEPIETPNKVVFSKNDEIIEDDEEIADNKPAKVQKNIKKKSKKEDRKEFKILTNEIHFPSDNCFDNALSIFMPLHDNFFYFDEYKVFKQLDEHIEKVDYDIQKLKKTNKYKSLIRTIHDNKYVKVFFDHTKGYVNVIEEYKNSILKKIKLSNIYNYLGQGCSAKLLLTIKNNSVWTINDTMGLMIKCETIIITKPMKNDTTQIYRYNIENMQMSDMIIGKNCNILKITNNNRQISFMTEYMNLKKAHLGFHTSNNDTSGYFWIPYDCADKIIFENSVNNVFEYLDIFAENKIKEKIDKNINYKHLINNVPCLACFNKNNVKNDHVHEKRIKVKVKIIYDNPHIELHEGSNIMKNPTMNDIENKINIAKKIKLLINIESVYISNTPFYRLINKKPESYFDAGVYLSCSKIFIE